MKFLQISRKSRGQRSFQLRHFPGIALSLLLISVLAYLLGWSSLLSLKKIEITGTSQPALIENSMTYVKPPVTIGRPLARIDVHAITRAIDKNAWVTASKIDRNWFNGKLTVQIQERRAVASYVSVDGSLRFFDAKGDDFQSPLSYSGIPSINLAVTSVGSKQAVANLLVLLPAELLAEAKTFTVLTRGNVEMDLAITPQRIVKIKWGAVMDIPLKVGVYQKLLSLKENEKARVFDLSNPLSPITK